MVATNQTRVNARKSLLNYYRSTDNPMCKDGEESSSMTLFELQTLNLENKLLQALKG